MANYIETASISIFASLVAVAKAIEEGESRGVGISVAIVDPSLTLVAFGKSDNAPPHSVETSRRKANTAASTRRATGWMSERLGVTLPLGSGNLLTNVRGGVPLRFDGKLVGGLGIAGGTAEEDEVIAAATVAAIGAELD